MAADDEKIKRDIVKQLYRDSRVEGSKINITVKEGVVVLGGVASSFLERKAAFEDAWSVSGVLSVENLIQVAGPTGTRLRADREIKANVEGFLEWKRSSMQKSWQPPLRAWSMSQTISLWYRANRW